jgi:hypothetical protein
LIRIPTRAKQIQVSWKLRLRAIQGRLQPSVGYQ